MSQVQEKDIGKFNDECKNVVNGGMVAEHDGSLKNLATKIFYEFLSTEFKKYIR